MPAFMENKAKQSLAELIPVSESEGFISFLKIEETATGSQVNTDILFITKSSAIIQHEQPLLPSVI